VPNLHPSAAYPSVYSESWQFHSSDSLECQLLSTLLEQGDRRKLQLYLRLRKYISQLSGVEQLDSTLLRY
jgi:hypothetical protein